jgi:uncharacterized protein YunC (DUF1805 family)
MIIEIKPIQVKGHDAMSIAVQLPKTTLLAVSTENGYIMCGALDVQLLNERLRDRQIIAGRATGVHSIEQLLNAPLESVTVEAEKLGIEPGMKGSEAILRMI